MHLTLTRFLSDAEATLGVLRLDDTPFCFTLEDEHREEKVAAETRIPAGTYRIGVRHESPMVTRYKKRFPWHMGMLHLLMVPGFQWIYIHIGNFEKDTAGCILVAQKARVMAGRKPRFTLQDSTAAYEALYKQVYAEAEMLQLAITIEDKDR